MKEGYIERKIHICKELVENSTSEEQKKIYQGYLEFWQEKAKNIKIHSKIPIKEEPLKEAEKPKPIAVVIPEVEVEKPTIAKNNKVICSFCSKEFTPQGITAHERACAKVAKLKEELKVLESTEKTNI